jgi:hypothetical protein
MGATYPIIAAYMAGHPGLGRFGVARNAVPPPDSAEQDGVVSEWFATAREGNIVLPAGTVRPPRELHPGTDGRHLGTSSGMAQRLLITIAGSGLGRAIGRSWAASLCDRRY